MKWVTWENVGVDRMACAWLIRKLIDPKAKFIFISAGQNPRLRTANRLIFRARASRTGAVIARSILYCANTI